MPAGTRPPTWEGDARVITEDRLRGLAAVRGEPVLSLYLNIDGRRYPKIADAEPFLEQMLKAAEAHPDAGEGATALTARIRERWREGFDRSRTRGVAFFVTGSDFEVVELPQPVRNQVAVNQAPALRQLESVLETYEPLMVVLVDRQRARLLRFETGELTDHTELLDDVPPRVDGTDDGGLAASHVQSHADEMARRHFRHTADVAFRLLQDWGSSRVVLGGAHEAVGELEGVLHSYVAERVVGRIGVPVSAADADITAAALAAEEDAERRREAETVARLREAQGNGAAVGIDDTLRAVFERRVDTLVVSAGIEQPGWRCGACEFLAVRGSACPMCEGRMEHVDDVVGEAVDLALTTGARVDICENADLDVLGGIGALLRF